MSSSSSSLIDISRHIATDPRFAPLQAYADLHNEIFWVESDVKASDDIEDWKNCSDEEKHFIKRILTFFSVADGLVNDNLTRRFIEDSSYIPQAKQFYGTQINIERIHEAVYKSFLTTFAGNSEEEKKIHDDINNCRSIRRKIKFVDRFMNSDLPFPIRLVAFAVIEGLLFSSSFCAIYWLKTKNKLRQLTLSNEWISRDEALHTNFSCHYFRIMREIDPKVAEYCTEQKIRQIIDNGVSVELEFVKEAFPSADVSPGFNVNSITQYVKCIANTIFNNLGFSGTMYRDSPNPFPWMSLMLLDGKTNFFERKVSEYKIVDVSNVEITTNNDDEEQLMF